MLRHNSTAALRAEPTLGLRFRAVAIARQDRGYAIEARDRKLFLAGKSARGLAGDAARGIVSAVGEAPLAPGVDDRGLVVGGVGDDGIAARQRMARPVINVTEVLHRSCLPVLTDHNHPVPHIEAAVAKELNALSP